MYLKAPDTTLGTTANNKFALTDSESLCIIKAKIKMEKFYKTSTELVFILHLCVLK